MIPMHVAKKSVLALSLTLASYASFAQTPVKNVILMIGDGMGPGQMGLLEEYARKAPKSIYQGHDTALKTLIDKGVLGMSLHSPADALVVDSACSASHLASGVDAPSEALGLDIDGNPVESVLEIAKKMGKATGLVSDTRLTHATPAAFASHQPHRSFENEIAEEMLATGVDVMLSGGLRYWIPKSANDKGELYQQLVKQTGGDIQIKSKRNDEKNLLTQAASAGYSVVHTRQALAAAQGDKVLGLFAYSGMQDGIEYSNSKNDPKRSMPGLKEMTQKALDVLAQDPDGFFLMVEGGQIDWAGHNNDAGTMLHEMLKFDETVQYVYDWVKDRNDTLVVVTADHETGGFGFSYSRAGIVQPENRSGSAFKDHAYKPNFNFGGLAILDKLYAQKTSFANMLIEFDDSGDKKPQTLQKIVNANSEFDITLEQAKAILETEPNHFHDPKHSYLSAETFPKVDDFEAFYVYGEEVRSDLIGRAMGEEQNIVWGTGTHTDTPVAVIAYGPDAVTAPFSQLSHHTDVGQLLIKTVKGS
ncbi:alkaline phosphatase [Motilimonas sp. 1_MG-2023]|uniref:alkaline phosphatase n=1 Tax=Motilimonas sp. 1_MG-2023 TaxID=3062672 RepID=UPI0026E32C5F|nr:alkaline phosphatase [Motilimonas sp. 1_MG-2023]MDO6525968.1 alkaline phosphatase [Motilimonas sp. 1_MG-2023]